MQNRDEKNKFSLRNFWKSYQDKKVVFQTKVSFKVIYKNNDFVLVNNC